MNPKKTKINSECLLYESDDGQIRVCVRMQDKDIWVIQKNMAEVFDVNSSSINEFLSSILNNKEPLKDLTTKTFTIVEEDGREVAREIEYYNFNVRFLVGFVVNFDRATDYKNWSKIKIDHFEREALVRFYRIRALEILSYKKLTDFLKKHSCDYDKELSIKKDFFATFQNKLFYAIVGMTAAEIIKK